MINFQYPAFPDLNDFFSRHLYTDICLSSELYKAATLETQEQANKTA